MYSVHAKHGSSPAWRLALGAAFAGFLGLPAAAAAQQAEVPIDYDAAIAETAINGSYGYFRALEGSATLIQSDTGERIKVEINEPILVGDRIFIAGGSRAEIVLADRNLIRIGDEAELAFPALANSGDSDDLTSVLELTRGTLQLVVVGDQLASAYPSVLTPNASVLPRETGSILVVVDSDRRTEVVVRDGRAEVHTDTEAAEVRQGESLFVEGSRGQDLEFAAAPSLDRLEAWGDGLLAYGDGAYTEYVDSDLHYGASTLRNHGTWVTVGGSYAWRPRVEVGWAPYRHGRWRYTPTGMFWVSYEPWGWTPYHYGYWDHHVDWGWVWYPGRRFSGAHVHWYWGPTYAGWIPNGYYYRHYGGYYGSRFGFHFGVYGHIGGGWGPYRHWTFLPHGRLGHRRQYFYSVGGYDLGRRRTALERGVLFTDTRSLRPDSWRRPNDVLSNLRRAGARDGRALRDANSYVERGGRLPQELERVTLRGRDGRSVDARNAGGSVRSRADAGLRPNATTRSADSRTRTLDRTSIQRATGRDARDQSARPTGRSTDALRRPTDRASPTGVQRPTTRSRVQTRDAASRPAARQPVTRDRTSPTLRRPDQPVTRPNVRRSGGTTTRPSARSTPSSQTRPTIQRGTSRQPTTRPAPPSSSRPTVRRSGGSTTRPSARSTPPSSTRPTVRRSGGSTTRPSARSTPPTSTRPTVRRSNPSTSRPTVRRSTPSSSRPTVRRSGGSSSRPAARPTTSRSTRPSVSRSGGSSRPAARSTPPRTQSRPAARPAPSRTQSRPAARPSTSRSRPSVSRSAPSRSGSVRSSGSSSRGGAVRSSGGSRGSRSSGSARRGGRPGG